MDGFATEITLTGPFRSPRQMLANQEYDGHASVHDDETAAALGLAGAPIEGPTHFSQFDPLGVAMWGHAWFDYGCISAHFENMVVEGEQVQASVVRTSDSTARIRAVKEDGTTVLSGTMTLGPDHAETELDRRKLSLKDPGDLFIIDQLRVGATSDPVAAVMTHDERNGHLYPFSLAEKLQFITEPSPWYAPVTASVSPWGRAIVPTEMVSVLAARAPAVGEVRGPSLGLFMDLEIRMIDGPIYVGHEYVVQREVVALGQTRRVEFYWTRTTIVDPAVDRLVATVTLNQGVFKESFAGYPATK